MASPVLADGNKFSVTGFTIDNNQLMSYKKLYEVVTTTDTITAAESGKTFFIDNDGTALITLTLPTAAAGLNYSFVISDASLGSFKISPASTDTLVGCVNGTSDSSFTAGDSLDAQSTPTTGDTVSMVGVSTIWYCDDMIGTWVDGN